MSTRMDGIYQPSLFSAASLRMDVVVGKYNRYRVLAENLPWVELAEVANLYRAKKVDIHNGRPLDLRLHIGALIAQTLNGWTDRETEENVMLNAGVRLLCGLEQSLDSIDHTSIETFRSQLGQAGIAELNGLMVRVAIKEGFTGTKVCSSDTTVQEAPIAYPTEVGHLKNISEKLLSIGASLKKGMTSQLRVLSSKAHQIYTKIRLFTRGKNARAVELKKKLGSDLRKTVAKMERLVRAQIEAMGSGARSRHQSAMSLYKKMLSQIQVWMKTGFHPNGKILSLWLQDARSITRKKAGKMTEFGRRWIITRLKSGYIIGAVCKKLGGDSDVGVMDEVLENFKATTGVLPGKVVYDRGGDGPKNHALLKKLKITNCIFRKGPESQPGLGRNTQLMARRERALSEACIATIKNQRYGFNKPRARSSEGCVLKGHAALLGANLTSLIRDWSVVLA